MKEQLEVKIAVEYAWDSIKRRSQDDPVNTGVIKNRLTRACVTQVPVTLFSPWGVRPAGTCGAAEGAALLWLQQNSQLLNDSGIPNRVLIMPADVYAMEINGINEQLVTAYFGELEADATKLGFTVISWSEIRSNNRERYDTLKQWTASPDRLWKVFPKALWYRDLLPAAFRRNTSADETQIKASAFAYLQERVVEAQVINEVYQPIKVSLVSREKDVPDGDLPRIYVFPRKNRFPWLYGGEINAYEQ